MKSARPSLSSLVAKKPIAHQEAAPAPPPLATAKAEPAPQSDRVGVMIRLTAAQRKSLRRIALDCDTTVQSLVEESIKDMIRRHEA